MLNGRRSVLKCLLFSWVVSLSLLQHQSSSSSLSPAMFYVTRTRILPTLNGLAFPQRFPDFVVPFLNPMDLFIKHPVSSQKSSKCALLLEGSVSASQLPNRRDDIIALTNRQSIANSTSNSRPRSSLVSVSEPYPINSSDPSIALEKNVTCVRLEKDRSAVRKRQQNFQNIRVLCSHQIV